MFQFRYMTFGMCNAAQTMQRHIHDVLRGLDFTFPYIDDICIASKNADEHKEHLRMVLQRLAENNLCINAGKCVFGQSTVKFLGHLVTSSGLKPMPEKAHAITNNSKGTKNFLGCH